MAINSLDSDPILNGFLSDSAESRLDADPILNGLMGAEAKQEIDPIAAPKQSEVSIPENTLAFRNNNPGNLRFAGQRGAVQGEGGFARFESPTAGFDALKHQIDLDAGRGHTLKSFLNKYAPPTENDTDGYLAFVQKETGFSGDDLTKDLDQDKLARAMAKMESGTSVSQADVQAEPPAEMSMEEKAMLPLKVATDIASIGVGMAAWLPIQAVKFGEIMSQGVLNAPRALFGLPVKSNKELVESGRRIEEKLSRLLPEPETEIGQDLAETMAAEIEPILSQAHLAAENVPDSWPIVKEFTRLLGDIVGFAMIGGGAKNMGHTIELAKAQTFMDAVRQGDKAALSKATENALGSLREWGVKHEDIADPGKRKIVAETFVKKAQEAGITDRARIRNVADELGKIIPEQRQAGLGVTGEPATGQPLRSGVKAKTANQIMLDRAVEDARKKELYGEKEAEVPVVKETISPAPDEYVASVKGPDGKLYNGLPGTNHSMVADHYGLLDKIGKDSGYVDGFTDKQGKFYTSDELSKKIGQKDVTAEKLYPEELDPPMPTSVQPMNEVKAEVTKPTEAPKLTDVSETIKTGKTKTLKVDLDRLPDWVEQKLDVLYRRVESGELKKPKRMHQIAVEVLTDGEIKDPGLAKTFRTWYNKEKAKFEKAKETVPTDAELPPDIVRVDPETGRRAGVEPEVKKRVQEMDEVTMAAEIKLRGGEAPSARSVKEQAAYDKMVRDLYEEQLKEEGLGEVDLGEGKRSEISFDEETMSLNGYIGNERGAIDRDLLMWPVTLGKKTLKGLREVKESLRLKREAAGEKRGVPEGELRFENLSESEKANLKDIMKQAESVGQTVTDFMVAQHGLSREAAMVLESYAKTAKNPDRRPNIPPEVKVESKWLKKGEDPNELFPRRPIRIRKFKPDGTFAKGSTLAPAISRGEASIMENVPNIPTSWIARHLSFENAIRTFERMGDEVKELWYYTIKDAEHAATLEKKQIKKDMKKLRKTVKSFQYKRIQVYAIAQQRNGMETLRKQGVEKIPKLTEAEMNIYEDLRGRYEDLYDRLNIARELSGEDKFPKTSNYFTFVQDLSWAERTFGLTMMENWKTLEGKMYTHKRTTSSWWAKKRDPELKDRKLELNPFTVFDTYSNSALDYIHKSPETAKLNELLMERFKVRENAPESYNFLRQWLDYQNGKVPEWGITNPITNRILMYLNKNLAWAFLSYSTRATLIQSAAIVNTIGMTGFKNTAIGVQQVFSHSKWKFAQENSKVLQGREFDVSVFESMTDVGVLKAWGKGKKKAAEFGMFFLKALDQVTATATWLSAYHESMISGKSTKKAKRYADDIVVKTQASAAKSDIAPIQYTALGKTFTGLQTFVINNWGMLTKDILGIKNADINNITTVKRVARILAASTLATSFYEDGLGLNSPFPTPIRAYREEIEESGEVDKAVYAALSQMSEVIPVISSIKYGGGIGGPLVSTVIDLVKDNDYTAIVKLLGQPGANQLFKGIRAYERGGSAVDIGLGRYVEKPKKSSSGFGSLGDLGDLGGGF